MEQAGQPPAERACRLGVDLYVEILSRLPDLGDKLAFGRVCRACRRAVLDPRCWHCVDVTKALQRIGVGLAVDCTQLQVVSKATLQGALLQSSQPDQCKLHARLSSCISQYCVPGGHALLY